MNINTSPVAIDMVSPKQNNQVFMIPADTQQTFVRCSLRVKRKRKTCLLMDLSLKADYES